MFKLIVRTWACLLFIAAWLPLELGYAHSDLPSPHADAVSIRSISGSAPSGPGVMFFNEGDVIGVEILFDVDVICSNPSGAPAFWFTGDGGVIPLEWAGAGSQPNSELFRYTVTADTPNGYFGTFDYNPDTCQYGGKKYVPDADYFNNLTSMNIEVDTLPPEITSITAHTSENLLKPGDELIFTLRFAGETSVMSSGVKAILNNGAEAEGYSLAENNVMTVSFRYVVQPGDDVDDLRVMSFSENPSNQAVMIYDAAMNWFDPSSIPAAGLPFDRPLVVDTTAPNISAAPTSAYAYARSHDVIVTATDRPGVDVQLYYAWTEVEQPPAAEEIIATGAFSGQPVPHPEQADGMRYLHLRAVDDAGNETVQSFGPYAYDRTAPTVTFTPPSDEANESITIEVEAEDVLSGVKQISYSWLGVPGEPIVTADRSFSVTTPPNEGEHVLVITAEDNLGNIETTTSGVYRIDRTAPSLSFTEQGSSTPAQTHTTTVQFSQAGEDRGEVYVLWAATLEEPSSEDPLWQLVHEGVFPAELPVSTSPGLNGVWYLHVMAVDSVGNTAIITTADGFMLDNEMPNITFIREENSAAYAQSATLQLMVDNKAIPAAGYTLSYQISQDEGPNLAEGEGGWLALDGGTIHISDRSGTYYAHVRAVDQAGNEAILTSQPLLLDHLAPTGSVSVSNGYTNTTEVLLELQAEDHLTPDRLEVMYSVDEGESWTDWTAVTPIRVIEIREIDGLQTIMVRYRDEAGNISEIYQTEVIFDTTPPEAVEIAYEPLQLTNGSVTATVYYTDDYSPDGTQSVTYEENGVYTVEFEDLAGNVNTIQVTIDQIDRQKPAVRLTVDGMPTPVRTISTVIFAEDNVSPAERIELSYAWSMSRTETPEEWQTIAAGDTVSWTDTDGEWYLWTKAIDEAGNQETAVSQPYRLDNTAPQGTLTYSTLSRTAMPVTAYLEISEPATVTAPVNGEKSYTFTENGTYMFEFVDTAGNVGTVTAEVTWIDTSLPKADITMMPNGWTNQPVDVKVSVAGGPPRILRHIHASDGAVLISLETVEYGTVWEPVADATVTEVVYRFADNGYLKYTIEDLQTGLVSETESTVNQIDRVPPTAELLYSHSGWTNEDVMVTLMATDDRSDVTVAGGDTYIFTENGTYTFEFYDEAGNLGTATAVVDFIDKTAPLPSVTYSVNTWTNGAVEAVVSFADEQSPVRITNNGGSPSYTFLDNGSFTFFYEDEAGNNGQITATVSWIDRKPPTGKLIYSTEGWTKDAVTVTLITEDDSGAAPTIISDGGDQHVFTENGRFTFIFVDAAGNRSELEAAVDKIDTTPPQADIYYSATGSTNAAVRATLVNASEPITVQNNGGRSYVDFTDNGEVELIISDRAGNINRITAAVDYIDRQAPSLHILYSTTELTSQDVIATVMADEPIYVLNHTSKHYVFKQNGSFTFIVQDMAGNTARISAEVLNIDKTRAKTSFKYSRSEPTNGIVTATLESDRPLTVLNNNGSPVITFTQNGVYWLEAVDATNHHYLLPAVVTNIDREPPTIRFASGGQLLIGRGEAVHPLADVTAMDNVDGDLTGLVKVDHQVDVMVPGDYEITYRVTDRAGNERIVVRTVKVIDAEQLTVYVNSLPPVNGELLLMGNEVTLQVFGEQGLAQIWWAHGKLYEGQFKTGQSLYNGEVLKVDKQGYYTFLVQDQERNREIIHVYIIPN